MGSVGHTTTSPAGQSVSISISCFVQDHKTSPHTEGTQCTLKDVWQNGEGLEENKRYSFSAVFQASTGLSSVLGGVGEALGPLSSYWGRRTQHSPCTGQLAMGGDIEVLIPLNQDLPSRWMTLTQAATMICTQMHEHWGAAMCEPISWGTSYISYKITILDIKKNRADL